MQRRSTSPSSFERVLSVPFSDKESLAKTEDAMARGEDPVIVLILVSCIVLGLDISDQLTCIQIPLEECYDLQYVE